MLFLNENFFKIMSQLGLREKTQTDKTCNALQPFQPLNISKKA